MSEPQPQPSLASPAVRASSSTSPLTLPALCAKNLRVGLLDADLGLANSQISWALMRRSTSVTYSTAKKPSKCGGIGQGLLLIPGASGNQALANITPIQATSLIDQILQSYPELDVLLIDSAAGLSAQT